MLRVTFVLFAIFLGLAAGNQGQEKKNNGQERKNATRKGKPVWAGGKKFNMDTNLASKDHGPADKTSMALDGDGEDLRLRMKYFGLTTDTDSRLEYGLRFTGIVEYDDANSNGVQDAGETVHQTYVVGKTSKFKDLVPNPNPPVEDGKNELTAETEDGVFTAKLTLVTSTTQVGPVELEPSDVKVDIILTNFPYKSSTPETSTLGVITDFDSKSRVARGKGKKYHDYSAITGIPDTAWGCWNFCNKPRQADGSGTGHCGGKTTVLAGRENKNRPDKVWICHAKGNVNNGYVLINVDPAAIGAHINNTNHQKLNGAKPDYFPGQDLDDGIRFDCGCNRIGLATTMAPTVAEVTSPPTIVRTLAPTPDSASSAPTTTEQSTWGPTSEPRIHRSYRPAEYSPPEEFVAEEDTKLSVAGGGVFTWIPTVTLDDNTEVKVTASPLIDDDANTNNKNKKMPTESSTKVTFSFAPKGSPKITWDPTSGVSDVYVAMPMDTVDGDGSGDNTGDTGDNTGDTGDNTGTQPVSSAPSSVSSSLTFLVLSVVVAVMLN